MSIEGSTLRRAVSALAFILLCSTGIYAAEPTFTGQTYAGRTHIRQQIHADLNNDGVQDLITASDNAAAITTFISNGNGSFQAGVDHAINTPNGSIGLATGDIDRDGKADILVTNGTNILTIFYGNGNGTFTRVNYTLPSPNVATGVVVSDFNRDGKPDIALAVQTGSSTFGVRRFFGTGTRTLGSSASVYSQSAPITGVFTGDLDGDAKSDVVAVSGQCFRGGGCVTQVARLFGDGAGNFSAIQNALDGFASLTLADLNKDGRSDILAAFENSDTTPQSGIEVVYGSATRSAYTPITYSDPQPADYFEPPQVADFNGDGKNDIAAVVNWTPCTGCAWTRSLFVFDGASGFTSISRSAIDAAPTFPSPLTVMDIDPNAGNKRPDLFTSNYDTGVLDVLLNTTSTGTYSMCPDSASPEAIHFCSPASGAIFSGSVPFSVAVNSFYPMRKLEIWVNGAKKSETYNTYATEAFVDTNLVLANGTYTATLIAAGYDNRLIKKNVSFSVGGASTCPAPSTATATVICSPANGSTVSSPVSVVAKGGSSVTFMEVWVDGTKRFQTSGNNVSTSLTLAAGSHHLSVFGKNGSTVLSKAVSDFTVK
jgi:FG-GAP-like repeat